MESRAGKQLYCKRCTLLASADIQDENSRCRRIWEELSNLQVTKAKKGIKTLSRSTTDAHYVLTTVFP